MSKINASPVFGKERDNTPCPSRECLCQIGVVLKTNVDSSTHQGLLEVYSRFESTPISLVLVLSCRQLHYCRLADNTFFGDYYQEINQDVIR
ncbi:hypothetical protein CDAR_124051 [Caerostris darwini]|uniref:Uncharacterized protein n=1 Tax=Caerostris darwini TaxID=1538125 RepID=A0AAV4TQW9_9ARAC|nr:hypothetical protein CDAR_124051 [Caerostris darwini]